MTDRTSEPARRGANREPRLIRRRWCAPLELAKKREHDAAAEFASKTLTQLLHSEIALDVATYGDADGACLFGTNDGDCVRFFSDTDAGTVTSTELRREKRVHRQREETGSGGDAIFLDQNSSIMERGAGPEDGGEQIVRKPGIERNTTFDVGAQADFTLDHDQGTGLVLRKEIGSEDDVVIGIVVAGRSAKKGQAAAEVSQDVTNLRLKNYDQGEDNVGQHAAENPIEGGEFADAREVED